LSIRALLGDLQSTVVCKCHEKISWTNDSHYGTELSVNQSIIKNGKIDSDCYKDLVGLC